MPTMPVVNWEMSARDIKKQAAFYSALFGWEFEMDPSGTYARVMTGGLDGAAVLVDPPASDVHLYVQVPNVKALTDKTPELGGAVITAPGQNEHGDTIAFIKDPEGGVWGLIQETSASS